MKIEMPTEDINFCTMSEYIDICNSVLDDMILDQIEKSGFFGFSTYNKDNYEINRIL